MGCTGDHRVAREGSKTAALHWPVAAADESCCNS